ncbi:GspH/FimT family pseudopilin [Stenotrophobium rhamnosiphilum]|uniref:GspH/FimT family pseudopilin n=1 Tax=Stenotrophobium rhamnosiphilum TaxID=2029166 RepID=UPI0011B25EBA|nr:GspH/FimT family pseudopilin [Stenotrophobium rhamnosiphilum]
MPHQRFDIFLSAETVRARPRLKNSGFSLIELLAALLITGILSLVALPSFASLIRNNRIVSESNSLLSTLMLTRSEAIKRREPVTLCKSRDGKSCSASAALDWNHCAIMFADSNSNRVLDEGEKVIRIEAPFSMAQTITFSGGNTLSYRADGSSTSGTFTIKSEDVQKQVVVSLAGRARIK